MREQGVDHVLRAVDQVEHAWRDAGLVCQLDDARRRKGDLLAGLQDEGVAGRDGVGPEPARHHGRKIEGSDGGEDAERLADILAVDPCRDVLERLPHHQGRDPAGVTVELRPPCTICVISSKYPTPTNSWCFTAS